MVESIAMQRMIDEPPSSPRPPQRRSGPWLVVIIFLAGLAFLAGLFWVAWSAK